MASPTLTYTLTNGTTASASEVMQNFSDLLNGITDGTKDLSISALTCAGTVTLNGNTTIGNASSDTLTITASLASSIIPSSDGAVDIGSATYGLRALYLGDASGDTVKIIPATMSADRIYTLPEVSADASFVMTQGAQTLSGVKTFSSGISLGNTTLSYYVEGTFTPSVTCTTPGTLSISYTSQSGSYRRIGNTVFVTLTIFVNTITPGTASGAVKIDMTGIGISPSASSSNRFDMTGRVITVSLPASCTSIVGEIADSTGYMYISCYGSGGSADLQIGEIGNGDMILFTGFYFV